MIESKTLKLLENKKNLLAFSGGVDSTALFFLLLNSSIKFDIAIVNYDVREQSKDEVVYAKELCNKYNMVCHLHNAKNITKNFEANARKIRYDYFETIIEENNYDNLLTAHHLGDRFEWMLMQFCKGAGCAELAGMQVNQKRDNYSILRPLLRIDKSELLVYLDENRIKYFLDETNLDKSIKRNHFRHIHTNPLLKEYLQGIKKSFQYLDEDKENLIDMTDIQTINEFSYFKNHNSRSNIFTLDKHLKTLGHIITAKEREHLKNDKAVVLGRKYLVVQDNNYVFIAPYKDNNISMPKEYKELFRSLKIEPKLRPYLYKNSEIFEKVKELFIQI